MAVLMNKSSVSAKSVVAKQSRSRTMSVIVRASQPTSDVVVREVFILSDHSILADFSHKLGVLAELA